MRQFPKRFAGATLESLDTAQFECVLSYGKKYQSRVKEGRGLLLSGPPGVGKTWAILALTRFITGKFTGRPFDAEFLTAPEMFENLSVLDGGGTFDHYRNIPYMHMVSSVPWLVINDLGKEYRGGAMHDQVCYKLGRVLRARSERQLVTHITTNLPLASSSNAPTLGSVYGESITSLLREMVTSYTVTGPDRRKR